MHTNYSSEIIKNKHMKKYLILFIFTILCYTIQAQKNVVDKIVAIVGDEIILKSGESHFYMVTLKLGVFSLQS